MTPRDDTAPESGGPRQDPRRRHPRAHRYGKWDGGVDPLAPPYDLRDAVDALGESVMEGRSVRDAVRELLRQGLTPRDGDPRRRPAGLDALREQVRRRREQLTRAGDLAGPLAAAREQLDAALADEREAIELGAGDPTGEGTDPAASEAAAADRALREMTLDCLPRSTSGAVRELSRYEWLSPTAEATYKDLLAQLRDQALRAQLGDLGLGPRGDQDEGAEGGEGQDGEGGTGGQRRGGGSADVKELMADLNALLAAHARGEDTDQTFTDFMAKHGDAFPEQPADVDELIDVLARRAAAMGRLMRSLSKEQRRELASLMAQALEDADLASEFSQLSSYLQDLRPGAFGQRGERFTGSEPMSFHEGVEALGELSDLDALDDQLSQGDPESTLDDVDVEAVERQLGPGAAAQVEQLRRLEQELRRQGWVKPVAGSDALQLSPKALRQLGQSALGRVFAGLRATDRGSHEDRSAGASGEATGTAREWRFGDEQPVDAVATVRRAVQRSVAAGGAGTGGELTLLAEDFAVVETERRSSAAVALCVDLSWSMFADGRWASMKQTALALAHLIATRYPQDALQIIGFDRTARELSTAELAAVEPGHQQGTNLQHALALARRHVQRHAGAEPVILVVTDGEPTAHLEPDGGAFFDWPTSAETLRLTLTEVDAMTRSRIAANTFLLGEDPGLKRFADALARRNGGRVFSASPDRLGEYVVADYLRSRRGA